MAGGGRKPYKQKGTGRARQVRSARPSSPVAVPSMVRRPARLPQRTPKKMKAAALRGSCPTGRVRIGECRRLFGGPPPQYPAAALAALGELADDARVLVVLSRGEGERLAFAAQRRQTSCSWPAISSAPTTP